MLSLEWDPSWKNSLLYTDQGWKENLSDNSKCLQVPQLNTKSFLRIVWSFVFANSLPRLPKLIYCQVAYLLPVRETSVGMELHPIDLAWKKDLKRIKEKGNQWPTKYPSSSTENNEISNFRKELEIPESLSEECHFVSW